MRQVGIRVHVGVTLIRNVEISAGPKDRTAFQMVTDTERLFGDVESTRRHLTVSIHQIKKEGTIRCYVTTLITHDGLASRWKCPGNVSKSSANLGKKREISLGFQLRNSSVYFKIPLL
jgi:hypothetical protein